MGDIGGIQLTNTGMGTSSPPFLCSEVEDGERVMEGVQGRRDSERSVTLRFRMIISARSLRFSVSTIDPGGNNPGTLQSGCRQSPQQTFAWEELKEKTFQTQDLEPVILLQGIKHGSEAHRSQACVRELQSAMFGEQVMQIIIPFCES